MIKAQRDGGSVAAEDGAGVTAVGYNYVVSGDNRQGRPCGAGDLRRHSKMGPIVYKFFFYL